MTAPGTLDIIGVGPGDPELITLKAARLIAAADVVAYPTTGAGNARARSIAAAHIHDGQTEFAFNVPMCADPDPARNAYDAAAGTLRGHLDAGRTVALLCEGDPFLYGSAMYLYRRLAPVCTTRVTPGVTSLTACAAAAGHPLAERNDVLKILPAPLDPGRLRDELASSDTAVIVKIGRHFDKARGVLRDLGREHCATVIEHATRSDQRVAAVADFADGERPYFSTILVTKDAAP